MVNLVSDQTGLGNEVGLHSLVDGGSGDSSHGRGVVDNRGNNWGNSSNGSSVGHSSHTVASVTQTMSNKTNTVSGVTKTMSGQAKVSGVGLSGRSSHGGAQDGGKDNKGVHLALR